MTSKRFCLALVLVAAVSLAQRDSQAEESSKTQDQASSILQELGTIDTQAQKEQEPAEQGQGTGLVSNVIGGAAATDSGQTIGDFSLAGYGEKGKKTWDLAGKTADIFDEVVKLQQVVGNLYGKEENIHLTADSGDFNKANGKVHLQGHVVITTTSGTKLTTDTLDWDRANQLIATDDIVNIYRSNLIAVAKGSRGNPNLKKVSLLKDVKLNILPEAKKDDKTIDMQQQVVITCDGSLDIDYAANIAIFHDNVKVEREESDIYCDQMDLYFIAGGQGKEKKDEPQAAVPTQEAQKKGDAASSMGMMGSKIDKIIARGHVKVVSGENVSTSEEAIYSAVDKKLTLTGKPKLFINSTEGFKNASSGNKGPF